MNGLSPVAHGLLFLAGFAGGFIDAIAGGGGLITVPALLATGTLLVAGALVTTGAPSAGAFVPGDHSVTPDTHYVKANGVAPTVELLDRIRWPARNPDGRISKEFLSDVQKWYVSAGVVRSEAPLDQVLDTRYVDEANRKLGPFKLENAASTKAGCGK